ncbi:RNA polymerase sigma-70 factor [Sphingobacterium shayense]|uniref:RNA polymerase sigma-70 factor n=1 Tax=Sphingobacterium shayense TaxID=626343 RepID=UPI001555454F|nr:RNA polymerase sigma-70 factor [Sphingobacterium shayense]NQD69522.1 RNA polymerase sigma-70 factor [Sphingobacterium shayense]
MTIYDPPEIDEKVLLQELQQGSIIAFEAFYTRYYALLYLHAAQKVRDREVAKDIVHDLFTTIWQKREHLNIQGKISSYLYAAIRYRIIDYLAKEQSKTTFLESQSFEPSYRPADTDHLLREKLLQEQIEHVLMKLSPRVREVFELSRKQYLSHKEIAAQLNLSEHSVRGYIKDALRLLRIKLSGLLWVIFFLICKFL